MNFNKGDIIARREGTAGGNLTIDKCYTVLRNNDDDRYQVYIQNDDGREFHFDAWKFDMIVKFTDKTIVNPTEDEKFRNEMAMKIFDKIHHNLLAEDEQIEAAATYCFKFADYYIKASKVPANVIPAPGMEI